MTFQLNSNNEGNNKKITGYCSLLPQKQYAGINAIGSYIRMR